MTDNSDKPVVIVTGSSGYIGSAIVKKLAARYRVIGFDRDAAPHPPAEAECVCVDVTERIRDKAPGFHLKFGENATNSDSMQVSFHQSTNHTTDVFQSFFCPSQFRSIRKLFCH